MDKQDRKTRVVELGKDVLIVLLLCSALWLLARSRLFHVHGSQDHPVGLVQEESGTRADAARPLRMTANLAGSAGGIRYGVQYDAEAADALFQQVAGLLVEALSSAGEPERVTRAQWEQAQLTAPGVSFDFQGKLPMPVLVNWLSGEDSRMEAVVRRITLTVWQGEVTLYYRNEEDGLYYRCLSEVASESHLVEALAAVGDNGAAYAFESETYRCLAPDTLVSPEPGNPLIYGVDNPVSGGRTSLESVMSDLGFSLDVSSFYASGDEQVARCDNDDIRLSERGIARYRAGENSGRFQIPARGESPNLVESVEACRQLAAVTLGARSGQARLYLISAQETGEGLEVCFGYSLDGSVVQLESGCAARFLVRNGRIDQFELCFRSYTDSGERSAVLPVRQAAAALEAMGLEGEELLLVYRDTGSDTVTAAWAAAGTSEVG
ncbi:hypothetical protein [Pseudoflavonifractor phocaeensis]|uniref:hypothetical protein n=1 Tax=Pseudoflavonifractor phocaeensis TaxID=1870988 RepID=UPI001F392140|nr:hypothetical protein [Pseudoflavonifractor phocaeensis]MCF2660783.1 hypothetical protein [Pseudoflavonifractor phocaeensis]